MDQNNSLLDAQLKERIDMLERGNKLSTALLFGIIIFAATSLIIRIVNGTLFSRIPRNINAEVIEAKQIFLLGHTGKRRIVMESWETGGAVIGFSDLNGEPRLTLGMLDSDEAYVRMDDAGQKSHINISVPNEGPPMMSFGDKDGNDRLYFGLNEKEEPGIYLIDKNKAVGASLTLDDLGTPHLYLTHPNKQAGVKLGGSDADGNFHLEFFDQNGHSYWLQPPLDR